MGHREVQYRGLWDTERSVQYRGLWDIERCNIRDYGT